LAAHHGGGHGGSAAEQGRVEGARMRRGRGGPSLFIGGDLLASGLREGAHRGTAASVGARGETAGGLVVQRSAYGETARGAELKASRGAGGLGKARPREDARPGCRGGRHKRGARVTSRRGWRSG
jgi:hypothetical protein